ncbi:MAG: sulfite exporter TauE/SafE family protein [Cyanobacteria bacterium P01_A01_bin.40]
MNLVDLLPLLVGGFAAGISAGILGIGGGTLLVPMIVTLGYPPIQAVATSSLAIVITATSGSIQNWRMGKLNLTKILYLGVPSMITSSLGVLIANRISDYFLLLGFSLLLLINIYLISLRQSLGAKARNQQHPSNLDSLTINRFNPRWMLSVIATGGSAGIIAGLFGLGGGVVLVPLQIILLAENIKSAVQTSLGVIVITGFFACMSHALSGNVLFAPGICLGVGGLFGAQISTRFLPKLPDKVVSLIFRCFMGLLAGYMLVQAWNNYR